MQHKIKFGPGSIVIAHIVAVAVKNNTYRLDDIVEITKTKVFPTLLPKWLDCINPEIWNTKRTKEYYTYFYVELYASGGINLYEQFETDENKANLRKIEIENIIEEYRNENKCCCCNTKSAE